MRVLLIDDHAVVRDGIKRTIERGVIDVTFGEAENQRAALQLVKERKWDLLVVDLTLGQGSGLDVLRELKKTQPRLPAVVFTIHSEEHYARRAFKAGASAYVTKSSSPADLLVAIERVRTGNKYISPGLVENLLFDYESGKYGLPHESLSDREFEVLCLMGSGKTVGDVARQLGLSDRTVSTYRLRILQKMDMKTNADLTRYAIQNNLVT